MSLIPRTRTQVDSPTQSAFLRLVCALCAKRPLATPDPATGAFIRLVRRHMLAPLAYRAGIDLFRRDFIANSLLYELRLQTFRDVVDRFAGRNIPVIPIKGMAYTTYLYEDPGDRPMSDIDLLVPHTAFDRAAETLQRCGYWRAGSHRQHSPWNHAVTFKRKQASIDLHRSIIQPYRSRFDIRGLWQRARPVDQAGGCFRLDPVDEIVFHLTHIARHELLVPMVNYVDAARLLARGIPRGQIRERARQFRLLRAIDAALAVTDTLWTGVRSERHSLRTKILPCITEIIFQPAQSRAVQLTRKAWLTQGPLELCGLAYVGLIGSVAHQLRPSHHSPTMNPPRPESLDSAS